MFIPRQVKRKLPGPRQHQEKATKVGADEEDPRAKKRSVEGPTPTFAIVSNVSSVELDKVYYEEVMCGLEMLFSEYNYADEEASQWLKARERMIEEESGCALESLVLPNCPTYLLLFFRAYSCALVVSYREPWLIASSALNVDIHLSSILDHPLFNKTKPALTQAAIQNAFHHSKPSEVVEVELVYHLAQSWPFNANLRAFLAQSR